MYLRAAIVAYLYMGKRSRRGGRDARGHSGGAGRSIRSSAGGYRGGYRTSAFDVQSPDGMNPFLMLVASQTPAQEVQEILDDLRTSVGDDTAVEVVNTQATDGTYTGGYYPLHYACQWGNTDTVRVLLDNGADPNTTKNNGASPLMCAVFAAGSNTSNPMFTATDREYEACVRMLLEHPKFDLAANDEGFEAQNSPVWCAVGQPYEPDKLLPLLRLLLARGFDPNGTVHGQPALHMAVRYGHTECAKALVMAGADTNLTAPERYGVSPEQPSQGRPITAIELVRSSAAKYRKEGDVDAAEACISLAERLSTAARAAVAVSGQEQRHVELRQASEGGLASAELLARGESARATAEGLMKIERWEDANAALEEAIMWWDSAETESACSRHEIDGQVAVSLSNMVAVQQQMCKFTRAVETARRMTERFPEHPIAWYNLAKVPSPYNTHMALIQICISTCPFYIHIVRSR